MIINPRFKDKRILIFGLGKTGIASIKSLDGSGAIIYAWDDSEAYLSNELSHEVKGFLKSPSDIDWNTLDYLLISPGIPISYPEPHYVVKLAYQHKVEIISDIDILFDAQKRNKFIGITGTNGKSTTTSMISHILKQSGIFYQIGGNIGTPVLSMNKISSIGNYLLEMSSFQLDLINKTRFNIAVLLNITKDHIDRHGSMEHYIQAKCKIFAQQNSRDWAIISIDNAITNDIYQNFKFRSKKVPISTKQILDHGVTVLENEIIFNLHGHSGRIKFEPPKSLPGACNRENIAASFAVGLLYNLSPLNIVKYITSFKPLEHRMEYVLMKDDVYYYNDSKSTNAESSISALTSFKNIFWIVGGRPKEGGIESLAPYLSNVTKAYVIGEASIDFSEFLTANNIKNKISYNLEQAFIDANNDASMSPKPAYIILSPACASFDQFKNFEERGNAFKRLIKELG